MWGAHAPRTWDHAASWLVQLCKFVSRSPTPGIHPSRLSLFLWHYLFKSPRPLPCLIYTRKGAGQCKHDNDNKNSGKRLWFKPSTLPIFLILSYPGPIFFHRVPRPKFRFFAHAHLSPDPRPFSSKPPLPLPPTPPPPPPPPLTPVLPHVSIENIFSICHISERSHNSKYKICGFENFARSYNKTLDQFQIKVMIKTTNHVGEERRSVPPTPWVLPPWCGEHTHHAPGTTQQAGLCSCVNLCPDPLPQKFIPVACHCFYDIICLNRPAPFLVLFIQGRGRGNVNTIMIIKTVASDCGSNPLPRPFF